MLPDAHHRPAGGDERVVDPNVPLLVAAELRRPVAIVRPRLRPVIGAHMPEAAIDEQRHPLAEEGDVDPDSDAGDVDEVVLPEPQPPGVER